MLKYVSHVDDFRGTAKGRIKRLNQTRIKIAFPAVSYKDKEKYILEIIKPILLKKIKLSLANANYYFETKVSTKYYANNGNIVFDIVADYEEAEEHVHNFVKSLKNDVKLREITSEEFETEKKVFITNLINMYDNVLESALLSAKTLALTKQTFSESSERLKIEVLTNKDANKLLNKILDFEQMVVIYLGHDIDIDFDKLVSETK